MSKVNNQSKRPARPKNAAGFSSRPDRSGWVLLPGPGRPGRLFFTLLLLLVGQSAWPCSVPVFRYALERWPPDSYGAIVFHRGPLSEEDQRLARDLGEDGAAGRLFANVTVQTIDLESQAPGEWTELWQRQKSEQLPWLVVLYPRMSGLPVDIWSGPLSTNSIRELLDSPARRELIQRLAKGETAVWLFLEAGDKLKDEPAAQLLQEQLKELEKRLELPALETADASLVADPGADLRVRFSMLRLGRDDPAERALVRMLVGLEEDLAELSEPMAFPVFGRGRALFALVGRGINQEMIAEACSFLTGPCSCQVKELNPGVDLLLSADWESLVYRGLETVQELPALAGLEGFAPDPPEASPPIPAATRESSVSLAAQQTEPPAPQAPAGEGAGISRLLGMVGLIGGLGLAVVALATLVFLRRKG